MDTQRLRLAVTWLALTFLLTGSAAGQNPSSPPPVPEPSQGPDEHAGHVMPAQDADDHAGHDTGSDVLFTSRDASGTAWQPDATPMFGLHRPRGAWDLMLHGSLFLQYLHEGGEVHRRGQQAGSLNWIMGMARRHLAGGQLGLRGMFSVEPWTVGGCGYPVLLATGESCDGDSIHDRQHPHDLFMELSAEYDRPLTSTTRWQLYGGLAGEPALGPPGFPHRLSAMSNLLAPIGHHWLDSTHITFGVVTASVYGRSWKAEASAFNGREPDERRTDLDLGVPDSFAGRLQFAPSEHLVLQGSVGNLREAEQPHGVGPRHDVFRTTFSATYHVARGTSGYWATTAGWGMNRELLHTTHAGVAESVFTGDGRHTVFGRIEIAGKEADDLHVHESTGVFTVARLQGGYVRYLRARAGIQPGIGGTVSASLVPPALSPRYGGRVTPGFGVFLAFRSSAHPIQ